MIRVFSIDSTFSPAISPGLFLIAIFVLIDVAVGRPAARHQHSRRRRFHLLVHGGQRPFSGLAA